MNFRPLHDRVVVRRVEEEQKTQGRHHHSGHRQGEADAGRGHRRRPRRAQRAGSDRQPLDVKAGDRVLFGKWSGTEVKIDGEELLIMKESDIMGIIEGMRRCEARPPDPISHDSINQKDQHMAAKDVKFSSDARNGCCAASTSWPTR